MIAETLLYVSFFFSLFISFFILYLLSKNDFVLVRQNVSLTEIFNLAIAGFIVASLASRLFYIFDTSSWEFLNPLRFFHLLKLPGLSLFGFYIIFALWIYIRVQKQKTLARVLDIISLSFSPIFLFSLLVPYFKGVFYYAQLGLFIIFLILIAFLLRANKNYKFKDGSIASLVFFLVSIENFVLQILFGENLSVSPTFYLSFILGVMSLGIFIYNQKLFFFKKDK